MPRSYIYKKHYGMIHCIAHCKHCEWVEEGHKVAKMEANKHSRKTGHTVAIEVGTAYDVTASPYKA